MSMQASRATTNLRVCPVGTSPLVFERPCGTEEPPPARRLPVRFAAQRDERAQRGAVGSLLGHEDDRRPVRLRGARETRLDGDRYLGTAADEVQHDQAEAS